MSLHKSTAQGKLKKIILLWSLRSYLLDASKVTTKYLPVSFLHVAVAVLVPAFCIAVGPRAR